MLNIDHANIMTVEILDKQSLEILKNAIGEEALSDFCERFIVDCQARADRIISAYNKSQFTELELEAHTLASSSATYGAKALEELCREIEFARPIRDAGFQERIDRLKILTEESVFALNNYMHDNGLQN